MPKSELLTKILSDYLAANPAADKAALATFCDYAAKWLCDCGLVGLGFSTGSGMRLRTAAGEEIALYDNDSTAPAFIQDSVAISGVSSRGNPIKSMADTTPSFGITGR